jgi:aminopeptidase N
MIAVSNGVLVNEERNADGTKTFFWRMDRPYSNYLTTLIVGEYVVVKERIRGTELEYNLPEEWVEKMDFFYGRTPHMVNFFSDYIIPYPYKRYAQTTVQDFEWGGMENITATTLNRRILHDEKAVPNYRADDLIAHELAHQWFGDYLTCTTWDHIWLNEGFATYFTDLWLEDYFGADEFRYDIMMSNNSYFDEQLAEEPLESIQPPANHKPAELSGGKAYNRGAAVLHALRFELGDENFKNGIKHYVNKFSEGVVVTEDFRIAMEEVSGRDLSGFFRQWIYGAGFPEFDVSYEWNSAEEIIEIKVNQVQKILPAVGLFDVPLIIEIIYGKEKLTDTVRINKKENSFRYNIESKPDLVRFNKYGWILCKVNFEKSLDELVYQLLYDDDVLGRYTAAGNLDKFGKYAVPYLKRALVRENFYGVRMRIVEYLKEIGGDDALELILFASNDFDGRVREAAVKALAVFSYEKVGTLLIDKLKYETNDYVKGAAAYSIGAVEHPEAMVILTDALKTDSHRNIIRRGIFEGFAQLGDPSVLPLIAEYTKYKFSYGGMHLLDIAALDCAKSFSETHYKEVVDVIGSALFNPYFRTRIHAAKLLSELKAVEKLPLIKEIIEGDRRTVVKEQLKKYIEELESDS